MIATLCHNGFMKISLLVPVYNSANIMPKLLQAIEAERNAHNWDLELIMVDDGSKDGSFEQMRKLSQEYPYIRGFRHSRNFGQQAALMTGLSHMSGDVVAIIDDDLQDPPSLLQQFFDKINEGYDVVYGVRRKRKENVLKVLAYKTFYKILHSISEVQIPLDSGDFCAMKSTVVGEILKLKERNPFIRGMRFWVGFKQTGLEYERPERADGESGMTLKKLIRFAFDGLYSFSDLPLKVTFVLGFIALAVSVIYSVVLLGEYLIHGNPVKGFATIILMILFFGSINLICLGIIGEYIARIYSEGKNRPHSIVAEIL